MFENPCWKMGVKIAVFWLFFEENSKFRPFFIPKCPKSVLISKIRLGQFKKNQQKSL